MLGASLSARGGEPTVELVETSPVETTLDHADLREAADVWREMFTHAKHRIDLGEFYVVSQPKSRLEPVIDALLQACSRGVKVRLLVDDGFAKHEHETLDRLLATKQIDVRRLNLSSRGGILHAKYFVVDGEDAYLGSQNFDWRSLEHIQELGVKLHGRELAGPLEDVFETDWALAGGQAAPPVHAHATDHFPLHADGAQLTPVYDPKGLLPDEKLWELPKLVELVDSAKKTVRVQLLTYQATARGRYFDELESALRRAAARNVEVQLLIADWCKRKGCIEGLKSLAALPHVTVKLVTIPRWSGGFIPYARVIHAKYLVVDGERAWVGTSNWERDYFYSSRNVGLVIDGGALPPRLDRFFTDGWNAPYAQTVELAASYEAPQTH